MKNIILLITDTFRWDNLDERAEKPVRTPELDKFSADRATAIERFTMGSFPTIPHRTDFARGVVGWPHYGWQPIDQSGPNHIAQLLGQCGYVSQLICDCPHLFNARFQHGFDAAYQHRGQEGDKPLLHMNDPISRVVPLEKTRNQTTFGDSTLLDLHRWTNRDFLYEADAFPAKTAGTAIRWLEENCANGPFFLWVDFFDPHEPWDPPEYLVKRYDPNYTGTPMLHPNYGPASAYTSEELHNLWAHYAAEAELTDRYIGRVLQKIDDLQLWEESIVVVLSDHGMSLGEHGRTGKSNICETDDRYWPIYPEIGHTLFLVAGSDIPKGHSLDLIAQPVDIMPTLCDLAGTSVAPKVPFDGLSFADAVLNSTSKHREYAISGSHIRAEGGNRPRRATTPFLVTDRWGYAPVGAYGKHELYDLSIDSLAANDLADDNQATVKELHSLLMTHLLEHGASADFLSLWETTQTEGVEGGRWAIDYADERE